jgi:hypothetical protein
VPKARGIRFEALFGTKAKGEARRPSDELLPITKIEFSGSYRKLLKQSTTMQEAKEIKPMKVFMDGDYVCDAIGWLRMIEMIASSFDHSFPRPKDCCGEGQVIFITSCGLSRENVDKIRDRIRVYTKATRIAVFYVYTGADFAVNRYNLNVLTAPINCAIVQFFPVPHEEGKDLDYSGFITGTQIERMHSFLSCSQQ